MPYPYKPTNGAVYATLRVADIATAETVLFAPGFSGRIKRATSVISAAFTTPDSTWKLQVNTTDVTNGSATVAFTGSAAGDVDQCIPTALNTFGPTDHIRVVNAGEGGGGPAVMTVCLELEPI